MNYVLIYAVLIGNLQYTIVEPMRDLNACRRMKVLAEASDKVIDVRCGAIILDRKEAQEDNEKEAQRIN